MEVPDVNNVYGVVDCGGRVDAFAAILRQFRGADVWLKISQFDGAESVRMDTPGASFHAYKGVDKEFLFNGAVSGKPEAVCRFTRDLFDALRQASFRARFEVYDSRATMTAMFGEDGGTAS